MGRIIHDDGTVVIGDKQITIDEARKLLGLLRKKKQACYGKKKKLIARIGIIENFIDEARGKDITLAEWMQDKGHDYRKFYRSMGYYTPLQAVVSDDAENSILTYHRKMQFNADAGFYVPKRKVVSNENHSLITQSSLGYTYDPKLALYFPTTIYDTDAFSSADGMGDNIIDTVGGFTVADIGMLKVDSDDAEEVTDHVQELFEEEFDNVEGEEDEILRLEKILLGDDEYSNAESGKNAVCRAGCDVKHAFKKSKRLACKAECDKKYAPSIKQTERREDREDRRDARQEKRETKKDLRQQMKSGEISRKEFRAGKKDARQTKREKVKEAGGNFVARAWRGVAKVFPITLAGRGGATILIGENAFGFATRLAPALVPEAEAKQKFTPEAIAGAKTAWVKLTRAWKNLGGDPEKLKKAILKGYRKKPMKVKKKSGFDGYDQYSFDNTVYVDDYSNAVDPVTLTTAITAGLGTLATLIGVIVNATKNPYKQGQEPQDFRNAMNEGALDAPPPDPNAPKYNPNTGEWVDPSTGKAIDPQTGEFKDNILGMNKWLAIGLGLALVTGVILIARKSGKK